MADYLNSYRPGLGYFAIFAGYGLLFLLSTLTLKWVNFGPAQAGYGTESHSETTALEPVNL